MEKISWTDRVRRNEKVLQRFKEDRNILRTVKRRKADSGLVTSCVGTAF